MDFETVMVGILGYWLGSDNGTQRANDYIIQQQARENEMLKMELYRILLELEKDER